MGLLNDEGRKKVAARILDKWPEWIEDICHAGRDDTPAQFQERCGRLALKLHYGEASGNESNDQGASNSESKPADKCDPVP